MAGTLEFEFEFGDSAPLEVLEVKESAGDGASLFGREPWMLLGIRILIGGESAEGDWLVAFDWMISSGFKKTLSDFLFLNSIPLFQFWSFMK